MGKDEKIRELREAIAAKRVRLMNGALMELLKRDAREMASNRHFGEAAAILAERFPEAKIQILGIFGKTLRLKIVESSDRYLVDSALRGGLSGELCEATRNAFNYVRTTG